MATIDLNLVRACLYVHELGSFSAAAQKLQVPRSTVSRSVATLEQALGVALFHRTTRTVKTTAAGLALLDRAKAPLQALEASLLEVPRRDDAPSGVLRITTTADLATVVLAPVIARYLARYPEVSVELILSSEVIDMVREDCDLALRIARGALRDSTLIARKIGVLHLRLYAAPSYLARRGTPRSPAELREHDWVALDTIKPLPMVSREAQRKLIARRRVRCNDMFMVRALTCAGAGISVLPTFLADADVAAGSLVRVLPRWFEQPGHVYIVQPNRKHVPRKVSAFRELLGETLRAHPL